MDDLTDKADTTRDLAGPGRNLPLWKRGMFWMFVGVLASSGSALWIVTHRQQPASGANQQAFAVFIAGVLVYVGGRILQIIQKNRTKRS